MDQFNNFPKLEKEEEKEDPIYKLGQEMVDMWTELGILTGRLPEKERAEILNPIIKEFIYKDSYAIRERKSIKLVEINGIDRINEEKN